VIFATSCARSVQALEVVGRFVSSRDRRVRSGCGFVIFATSCARSVEDDGACDEGDAKV